MTIRKLSHGIDFVGYVLFEKHILMRTRSKQRMKKRLKEAYENYLIGKIDATPMDQRLQSYLGILSHANHYTLAVGIKNAYWVRTSKAEKGSILKKPRAPAPPAKKRPKHKKTMS